MRSQMNLSTVFESVAHKQLSSVEIFGLGSKQHELNGDSGLRQLFGTEEETRGPISWHYFADDSEPVEEDGEFTFYDARAKSADKTGRSEWRFYYTGAFVRRANVGDTLIVARTHTGQVFGLIFQKDSAWLRAAHVLFGIKQSEPEFAGIPQQALDRQQLELMHSQILAELNLELALPVASTDERIVTDKFGCKFPTTRAMSEFARTQVEVDGDKPDDILVQWLEREEELFRALEKVIIGGRIAEGFKEVDVFIEYSLSVQNRRKSRMGFALQNHLAELFTRNRLRFTPQARTELNNRPDFVFPGESEYHEAGFDDALLVMLGVKSTSKDRWRQVLTEADRIPKKHLCTLEAAISTRQTDEMLRHNLTLVVPEDLHETYTTSQKRTLLSVADFIEFVRRKQTT